VPGLTIDGLRVAFGEREVLHGVDIQVEVGACVGLVGESGSGKSLTALTTLGLLPRAARVTAGEILLDGERIVAPRQDDTGAVRGSGIAMIFQSPRAALNPALRVGRQVDRVLGRKGPRDEHRRRSTKILGAVGLLEPEKVARLFPHELSGGMCQRVMIAMAIASEPRILLADEPTTALDVTVQADILDLLEDLRERTGMGMLLISHDLSVVAERCDSICVMWQGSVVEAGSSDNIIGSPKHPFTADLVSDLTESSPRRGNPEPSLPAERGSEPARKADR
jgi:ABC-type dipeptide/oligopeptide/nickel transport system ATPase component